jgi:hypothetical protein
VPDFEESEIKRITYKGFEYAYKTAKSLLIKNLVYIYVAGGPHRIKACTSCGDRDVKTELMKLIKGLSHHKLGRRTAEQERKIQRYKR